MKTPVISFVVPVYQKPPQVFRKCLESLFDMSLKEIEVICVFDGENPELQKVAGYYKKAFIHVIEHGGAPKARNAGLALAKGEYVCFWDADCYAKPEMAKRWIQEFEAVKEADFVYTGYEITGERGAMQGEAFDPYSLTCANYISSMSPIKREKAFQWDESLEAGQDWDYWLTAVDKGLKGAFIQGAGFLTDHAAGISSKHWSPENREATILKIKQKHAIPDRDIGIYSQYYNDRALKLAKVLGADLIGPRSKDPSRYKIVFNLGYNSMSRFEGFPTEQSKIQYWIPGEVESLKQAKYDTVIETVRISKTVTNFCATQYEKNKLKEIGIDAEIVPLPLAEEDRQKVQTELPKDFSVLVLTDASYGKLLKELEIDLPHIKFDHEKGKAKDYACVLSFYNFAVFDDAVLAALVNGRNVISNIQSPYCGFVDPSQNWETFKKELYEAIRTTKEKPFNKSAQDHYLEWSNPEKFKNKVMDYFPKTVLEVVQ